MFPSAHWRWPRTVFCFWFSFVICGKHIMHFNFILRTCVYMCVCWGVEPRAFGLSCVPSPFLNLVTGSCQVIKLLRLGLNLCSATASQSAGIAGMYHHDPQRTLKFFLLYHALIKLLNFVTKDLYLSVNLLPAVNIYILLLFISFFPLFLIWVIWMYFYHFTHNLDEFCQNCPY